MPTVLEPSEPTTSPNIPKPFAYFFAGLAVGAICVLLPFLCVLPLALHQARVNDDLRLQLNRKDMELANWQQMRRQRQNPPPPPPGYPPLPPPQDSSEPPFAAAPDMP